jgi:hypothetical protein
MITNVREGRISRSMTKDEVHIDHSGSGDEEEPSELINAQARERGQLVGECGGQEPIPSVQEQRAEGEDESMFDII